MNKKRASILILITLLVMNLTGCSNGTDTLEGSSNWLDSAISYPLAKFIKFFLDNIGDFGAAIIVVTIITRLLIWPLTSNMSNMSIRMQLAQPDLQKMKEKYIGKTDPESRKKMAMEQQAIMRKHGVKMIGCLAPLVQFPLFIGTYGAIRRFSITFPEIKDLSFYGIDLNGVASEGAVSAIVIMVFMTIFQGLSMYMMQKKPAITQSKKYKNPQSEAMQSQMKMMYVVMIVFLLWFAWDAPAALPFYWTCSSIIIIIQSFINRRRMEKKFKEAKTNII